MHPVQRRSGVRGFQSRQRSQNWALDRARATCSMRAQMGIKRRARTDRLPFLSSSFPYSLATAPFTLSLPIPSKPTSAPSRLTVIASEPDTKHYYPSPPHPRSPLINVVCLKHPLLPPVVTNPFSPRCLRLRPSVPLLLPPFLLQCQESHLTILHPRIKFHTLVPSSRHHSPVQV